jgi:hypothetical protein
VQQLPEELAAVDRLLTDPQLLLPFRQRWAQLHPGQAPRQGPPTIPMVTYLRVMVIKQRYGWVYETLLQEVSDSLHLRRFCLIPLVENVPHESTVRKLTRRLGRMDPILSPAIKTHPGINPIDSGRMQCSTPDRGVARTTTTAMEGKREPGVLRCQYLNGTVIAAIHSLSAPSRSISRPKIIRNTEEGCDSRGWRPRNQPHFERCALMAHDLPAQAAH